jgi:hypothetical protein
MNLKKIARQYQYFFLLAILFELRAIWGYFLSHDINILLVYSLIALSFLVIPFPLEAMSVWLEGVIERKKILGSVFVLFLVVFVTVGFWRGHSRIWAALNAFLGAIFLLAMWKDRISPENEERKEKRRAKAEELFADREAFEKNWQRRVKIGEGIILLLCVSLVIACWMTSFKLLAILPGLVGALFLIGLFADLTPMSDEKFEEALAKAKDRYARVEARRAEFDARRARRAEQREERKRNPRRSRSSAGNFSQFVYWSVLLCVFGIQGRTNLERPDLVFCALPAWYLFRALYFFIREQNGPKGPDAPLVSESPTAGQ